MSKIRVFQKGLIYVFSYKKYRKIARQKHWAKNEEHTWPKKLNGRIVTQNINPTRSGAIFEGADNYSINIAWCKCIGREAKIARIKKHRKISISKRKRKAGF